MPEPMKAPEPMSPIQRIIQAIRKRMSSETVDERAEAGKEAAQGAADILPGAVIPKKGLETARKRREDMDKMLEDAQ